MRRLTMKYDISKIEKLYPNWYDKTFPMSYEDQKWIWTNLPLLEEDEYKFREIRTSNIASVNGSVIGSYKREAGSEQNLSKQQAIEMLKQFDHKTPPKKLALYLTNIFGLWEKKPEHWLYIAQRYTPKTMNSVISQMSKEEQRGDKTFETPGAYFTSVIKFRPKRKSFRNTNGTHKQQSI